MRRDIPSVRIWPMSDRIDGFCGRSIADVQTEFFLRTLPAKRARFRYPSAGLNADAGTVILFQFQARIIASAVFLRNEKFERKIDGYGGALWFDPESIRTFEPWDMSAMQKVWPGFRAFGHVKQFLNPGQYPAFVRRLKKVASCRMRVATGNKDAHL